MERWKKIPEFPSYEVSSYGQISNRNTGHIMAMHMNQFDVVFVGLFSQGKQYWRSVPKLVARAFIPNKFEAYDTPINVDGDRWNNHIDNLLWRPRWFAIKYNRQFKMSYDYHIPYLIEDVATGIVSENSFECARAYGLLEKDIVMAIMNRTYVWPTDQRFRVIED